MNYKIDKIRLDFPIFSNFFSNHSLVYLDNAATAQKPNIVIMSTNIFYSKQYAAVHRSVYKLSNKATNYMEDSRYYISKYINSKFVNEIIFTKSSTEGLNIISNSWGRYYLKFNDNILLTEMEHHSNIVPWQILSKQQHLVLNYIPLCFDGILNIFNLHILVNKKTKIFSITQLSNILGLLNSLNIFIYIIKILSNSIIIIDGAQGIIHQYVNVDDLNCDFYVFSGHKIYGPSGIGILYGKRKLLNIMPPLEGGGSMINNIDLKNKIMIFNDIPWIFEAGSPNVVGIIGLKKALIYLNKIKIINIQIYEYELMRYFLLILFKINYFFLYGYYNRVGLVCFKLNKIHSYDIGCFLDNYGISIRTGHHCALPLLIFFNISSICRVSICMYTDILDINIFINSLIRIQLLLNN